MTDLTDRFVICLHATLAFEGGYDDDPLDSGGATNQGVTIGEFAAWHHEPLTPQSLEPMKAALRAMDDETRDNIYRVNYWQPTRAAELPRGIDQIVFDTAVNQGVGKAIKTLQNALGCKADGHMGVMTMAAAQAANPIAVIQKMTAEREAYYRKCKMFYRFGRGWLRRAKSIGDQAVASCHDAPVMGMALGLASIANNDEAAPEKTPKAPAPAETQSMITSTTSWAAILAGFAGLTGLGQSLSGLMGTLVEAGKSATDLHVAVTHSPVEFAFVIVGVLGVGAPIYIWLERQRKTIQG